MNGSNASAAVVQQNIAIIRERMATACTVANRNPEDVHLLLATKTVPAEKIMLAIASGEMLLGENKVQELREKNPVLHASGAERHFIGHLQTNKVKDVLKYISCIQSVDRISLAQALHGQLQSQGRILDIMVQVNTSFEASKFGVPPSEAAKFILELKNFETLRVTGLMTIGLFSADKEEVRPSFSLLREIKQQILDEGILSPDVFKHLSMGMSNDLETAIEEGATIVRVGTAIFGERFYPDSFYWNENQGQ